jgi:uroporphyrinogen decarboxylase
VTAEMTPVERVRTALNHEEPDRVPLALGGGPYGIVDQVYFSLLEHLQLGEPMAPFRKGHSISYMDDRLLEKLGTDLRYVWPGDSPSNPSQETPDPNVFLDGYGQRWRRAFPYYFAEEPALLAETDKIDDIDRLVNWPDPFNPRFIAGVRERAQLLRESTQYFITARMVTSHGPYMTACNLRGTEQFLLDMSLNPEFATALIERVTDTLEGLLRAYLEACGEYIDMVELPGDDYASNMNLIMSPVMFRKFIYPALARLVATAKSFRPDLKVMLHSDGEISRLLPIFVELGLDVINPLEPVKAMDQPALKAKFGDKLSFLGTIDISHALPGSTEDVVAEVKRRLSIFGPGGGYILAPSNHIQADVSAGNVVTLFESARQYGRYPLHLAEA